MNVSMKLVGGADLAKRLGQLPAAASKRVLRQALEHGAEPMRAAAESGAPRDKSRLAENIVVGTRSLTRAGEGEVIVEVGPARQPDDVFYGYFQEYGTVNAPAQPFMRPAFDTQVHRSLNIVMAELWAAIRKKLAIGGGRSTTGGNL